MPPSRRRSSRIALALVTALAACERSRVSPPAHDTARVAPVASVAPTQPSVIASAASPGSIRDVRNASAATFRPVDAADSAFTDTLRTELSHLLYQSWKPDTAIRYADCREEVGDGYELNAAWGVARIRLLSLDEPQPEIVHFTSHDTVWRQASANIEVVRVLSVEGDPQTSDGMRFAHDMLVVGPVTDTMEIQWHRRDGAWRRCGPMWAGHEMRSPMSIVGPDVSARETAAKPFRRVPAGTSWARARTIADSVERAGRR